MADQRKDMARTTLTKVTGTPEVSNASELPTPPFDLLIHAPGVTPTKATAEEIRVLAMEGSKLTSIERKQYGTNEQAWAIGWIAGQPINDNMMKQIEGSQYQIIQMKGNTSPNFYLEEGPAVDRLPVPTKSTLYGVIMTLTKASSSGAIEVDLKKGKPGSALTSVFGSKPKPKIEPGLTESAEVVTFETTTIAAGEWLVPEIVTAGTGAQNLAIAIRLH